MVADIDIGTSAVVKFYNDGVVQAVAFACLIY